MCFDPDFYLYGSLQKDLLLSIIPYFNQIQHLSLENNLIQIQFGIFGVDILVHSLK
jgi:hypothetical protein